jgi:hypothetical protein
MLRTQISVPSGQNLPKSEIVVAVLQQHLANCCLLVALICVLN